MSEPSFRTRAVTKLEVGLVLAILGQVAAGVWFAATLNATVSQLQVSVAQLAQTVAAIQATAPQMEVLKYRVQRLEDAAAAAIAAQRR